MNVEENAGTMPTISSHGFGALAPSDTAKRTRRPIALSPGARRSAKAWSTITAADAGFVSAAAKPRPARTGMSNTSNRFVATKLTREEMSAEGLSSSIIPCPSAPGTASANVTAETSGCSCIL